MKNILLILTIVSVLFSMESCDDMLTQNFSAEFKMNMDINVEAMRSEQYPFSHSELLNIADDEEVAEYIDNIKSLNVTQIECSLSEIPEGAEIEELTILIADVGLSVTLTNITSDYSVVLPVSDDLLNALAGYLYDNQQTNVVVYGISSYAPMIFKVKLNFHSDIEASL
jgi:hypothetical protein